MTSEKRVLRVAHSPDSDDAFMFYALAAGKIDTGNLTYVHELQDIETLNQRAMRGELEITAVSIHAYAYVADKYALLPSGASMGERYGPRLVARNSASLESVRGKKVGIPGRLTSAYLALQMAAPPFTAVPIPFDKIEEAVIAGEVDFGLLIHEGQLTFQDSGLHLILDLGEWWFGETGLPLPLGGNVVRKDLGSHTINTVSRHLRDSIAHALQNRGAALDHAMRFARGLDRDAADEFVGMYVNDLTLDYGVDGRKAVRLFLKRAWEKGLIPHQPVVEFVGD